jgi:hypothetical protein
MPIPKVQNSDLVKLKELAQKLWDGAEIENSKKMGEKQVRNYYFDKRMDILLEIDDWIVRHVAPELDFPKDIFAQYKSHSFLHPLDLQMLMQIPDLGDVQMENEE